MGGERVRGKKAARIEIQLLLRLCSQRSQTHCYIGGIRPGRGERNQTEDKNCETGRRWEDARSPLPPTALPPRPRPPAPLTPLPLIPALRRRPVRKRHRPRETPDSTGADRAARPGGGDEPGAPPGTAPPSRPAARHVTARPGRHPGRAAAG